MTQPITLGTNNGYASLVDDLTYRFDGIHDLNTVRDIRDQIQAHLTALLRDLNI